MPGSTRTRSRAVALLAAAVLGAACGGNDFAHREASVRDRAAVAVPGTPAPVRDVALRNLVRDAATRTGAQRTARTTISVTVTGIGDRALGPGALDVAGKGVVDLRSGDAALVLSVPRFDRISGGGAVAQRTVRGVTYLEMPVAVLRAGGLHAPVRWLRLERRPAAGADPTVSAQAQVDPAGQLAFLAAVSDDVRRVGAEPVRGVPATHYAATVAVPGASSRPATGAAVRLASIEEVAGAGRLTVDVWLDEQGRARRVVVTVPLAQASGSLGAVVGAGATLRVQADLFSFGTPVSVAAPPQAQVRPYASLHLPAEAG